MRRVGFDSTTKRHLFVLEVDSLAELLVSIRLASPRFVRLLAWDAAMASDQDLIKVADWLLRSGAVYVCRCGQGDYVARNELNCIDASTASRVAFPHASGAPA